MEPTLPNHFRGLRLPLPGAVGDYAQLGFATPMVLAQLMIASPLVIALKAVAPAKQERVLKAWMRGVLLWSGVDLEVDGLERLDPHGRYVFVSNHQSLFDVPCINTALPMPVRFVAKASLLKVPLFGAGMRAVGTVAIDRNDRAGSSRALQAAREGIARTASIHFFAEGTRHADGKMGPFKHGAASMALSLGVPLVPIAVSGTGTIFAKESLRLRPGRAHLAIGEPIPVEGADEPDRRTALTARAREAVEALYAGLVGQR